MKDLASLSNGEFKQFLDSFDDVLCDCDGVLWLAQIQIPGVGESLTKLQEQGKRIQFVTNNTGVRVEMFDTRLPNFKVSSEDIIHPTLAIVDYLKSIDFNKEILLIGKPAMRDELKAAGYNLADVPTHYEESPDTIRQLIQSNETIGAVVFDVDLTLNYAKLYRTTLCLNRPDVLFLAGCTDKKLPAGPNMFLIGPAYFLEIIREFTGREPLVFGKPGVHLRKYLNKRFSADSSRTLFIGDALESDIKFGSLCGYQKLLVLTGATKIEDISKCEDKELIPDYYLSSLGDLSQLIKDKLNI